MRPEPARDARARASMGYFLRCGLLAGLAAGRLAGFAAGFDLV
jgi:tetrahydromethanopterin S-methyltransferase subunit F